MVDCQRASDGSQSCEVANFSLENIDVQRACFTNVLYLSHVRRVRVQQKYCIQ